MRHRSMRGVVGLVGVATILLAVGLLSGCAGYAGQPGGLRVSEVGGLNLTASQVRTDPRVDQGAYYAYSRSVWAELQGNLEEAVRWEREALRYDPTSLHLQTNLAWLLLKAGDFRGAIQGGKRSSPAPRTPSRPIS